MKVEFTESAVKDLENILKYYTDQGASEAGRRLASGLLQKTQKLAQHPDSGRIVPEFGVYFLRELIVPPFRVVYRRDPRQIWIIRIWRSERPLNLE
jgi:plasmid stabilization system protein ParE